jgi:hypothetical protein
VTKKALINQTDHSGKVLLLFRTIGRSRQEHLAVTALNYGSELVELKAGQPLGFIEKPAVIYLSRATKDTSQATREREQAIHT